MSREADIEDLPDRISATFKGKTVFITGGTGFLGKVLVEKLLRCTEVARIYLLVRAKRGQSPKKRLKEIFSGPLFDQLRRTRGPQIFEKVIAIEGDVESPDLGINKIDRAKITKEIELIYHSAATIRFDDFLKKSVLLNVRGTKFMVDLARECKNLKLFCHISTAFAHSNIEVLEEELYEPLADYEEVIKMCEAATTEEIEAKRAQILGVYPNSYGFTKALGEGIINRVIKELPVIIVRPSIVLPIWKEPLPGWTDNLNGPTGLLIAAGKGVLRTMYGDKNICADYIPVDVAVNGIFCITFYNLHINPAKRVYNATSSLEYQISFQDIIKLGQEVIANEVPLNWVLWYPGGGMTSSRTLHNFRFFFYQLLPAILIDAFLIIIGIKPVLWRVQKRVWRGYEVFEYYINRKWIFRNESSLAARNLLNERERQIYKVDGAGMDYYKYFTDCIYAGRRYLLKESDDTIATAKRHLKMMWFLDKFCKCLIVFGVFYYVWNKFVSTTFANLY